MGAALTPRVRRRLVASVAVAILVAAAGGSPPPALHLVLPGSGRLLRVEADPRGGAYLLGLAYGAALPSPVNEPADTYSQPFVVAVGADGAVRWTRFVEPWPMAICAAAEGEGVWLATYGDRPDYGPGAYDREAYVTHLGDDGALLSETRLGGTGDEAATGLALLPGGDVVVVGTTESADLPVPGGFQSVHGGGRGDGFVARIRADGSGVAWTSFLGGASYDDAQGVAVDADGGVVVACREVPGSVNGSRVASAAEPDSIERTFVARVAADGSSAATATLPRFDYGTFTDMAAAPDGDVLVAGFATYHSGREPEGFVLRVDPAAPRVTAVWRDPAFWRTRAAVLPSGDVLVASVAQPWYDTPAAAVVRLSPDLVPRGAPSGTGVIGAASDIAAAGDDAFWLAGRSNGLALREGDARTPIGAACLQRMPVSGASPPSVVRVLNQRENAADLAWLADGDPVTAWEVERSTFVAAKDGYEWKVVKRLPPSRHRLHLVDLPTLSSTAFRVVAVFPSGLRSAVATPWVATRPPPVSRVRALVGADRVVTVTWDDVGSGGFASDYLVEKQTAGGRWVRAWPMGHVHFFYDFQRRFFDYVPAFGGTVRYRVGSASDHLRSTWTYSATIDIAEPDIEVRQEGGIATVDELGATELEVTGTITDGEPDPAPLALEQRDFELVIGGVGQPVRILAPESSGSWTRKGRVLRLEYSPFDDTVDRVVFEYDERTGRFRAHQWISEYSVPPIFTPGRRTQVEVGVASGTRAGGDVRTWQPVGRRGVFVLR